MVKCNHSALKACLGQFFTMSPMSVPFLLCAYLSLSPILSENQVLAWPIRVSSGTQIRSNSNSNQRIVTKCFPGMYLKIDCKMYFDCSNEGHFRRNFCDSGTYWNHRNKKCDEIQNVPECVAVYSASPKNRSKSTQQQPLKSSSLTASSNTEKASLITPKSLLFPSTTSATPSFFVLPRKGEEKTSTSTTQSTITSATHLTGNQLKGDDDDYIDPPNIDWDIDGVLGLDSGRERSEISKQTGNDITTEDAKQSKSFIKKEDPLKTNKEGSEVPALKVPTSNETHGKTCVIRGKEMVCSPAANSISADYTNQIFSQQARSSVSPLTDVTLSSTSNCSTTNKSSTEKVISSGHILFNITIHLKVQKLAIRLAQTTAYYINLSTSINNDKKH